MSTRGKVYLVGAGPGHPELLTLKAARLLERAEVVIYDRLVQEEVLALTAPACERIYMGKPLGRHDSRQEEIHQLLLAKAREGKLVVRLKGGDPFLFGRGGEEAEFLAAQGIRFEVIPGVSSALAAPASAGIAVTHRDMASAVAFVTGHEAGRESRLDWSALSRIDTLVFLMGVHNAGRIARKLMEHGRAAETPAAMIQRAFWEQEAVVTGTLADIEERIQEAGIQPPATLVIGEVVRLREKLEQSDRDLRRRAVTSPEPAPAPGPGPLFRLAASRAAAEVLSLALELDLFEYLEAPRTAAEVAERYGFEAERTGEYLESCRALGLVERVSEGYRNLELASHYLRRTAPQSLATLFACQLRPAEAPLSRYLAGEGGGSGAGEGCALCSEAVASLGAGALAGAIELPATGRVLLAGWGGEALAGRLSRRWPGLELERCNPLAGEAIPAGRYGAAVVSLGISSCQRCDVGALLEAVARRLDPGGVLFVQDLLQGPAAGRGAPEYALARLVWQGANGAGGKSAAERVREKLEELNFQAIRQRELGGGMVTAAERPR